MREIRAKYQAHVAAMLKLAGFDDSGLRAQPVSSNWSTAIAEKHTSLADNEDIHKANNTWKQADFAVKAPGLDWAEYFRAAGLRKQESFIVWQPAAFTAESALVASGPLETWKDWLAYHLIEEYAGVLPKAFADERFAFFGKTLSGTPKQRPRWQRGVVVVNGLLGDAVGQIYAAALFLTRGQGAARRPWSPTSSKLSASGLKHWPGWLRRPRPRPRPSSPHSTSAWATRKPGATTSALEIKPDDIFGNLWRGGLL